MEDGIKEQKETTRTLPEAVTEAQAKGKVLELTGEDGAKYYFKEPGRAVIDRYLGSAAKGKITTGLRNLVFDLAVFPDAAELTDRFEQKPGLVVALSNALQNAVGLNEEFAAKKL
jgi:hypothetical protein